MTACRDERRECVDAQNHLLPPSACQSSANGAHFVYGGSSGGHDGDTVVGASSVSRGGFGSTSGEAGGEGGGE